MHLERTLGDEWASVCVDVTEIMEDYSVEQIYCHVHELLFSHPLQTRVASVLVAEECVLVCVSEVFASISPRSLTSMLSLVLELLATLTAMYLQAFET